VLRGNSGAGKSTIARLVRARLTGCVAWVEQDYVRRVVLHEHDLPDGLNIGLIAQTVRYALDHGCDVILDGILYAAHYAAMLRALRDDHRGRTLWYWFDVSWEETLRRHATRPQSREFGAEAMRTWYRERDPLPFTTETLMPEAWTIDQTVDRILSDLQSSFSPRRVLEPARYIDGL
jgi:predicted kinase